MVPKEGRTEVFKGVNFRGVHDRLLVRRGQAEIEGRDGLTANRILPGNIDARFQVQMIHGKTGDFFHFVSPHC